MQIPIQDLINPEKNNLLILAGHSGSGKSALEVDLIKTFPDYFNKLPQITTRKMRSYEHYGPDVYYFVDDQIFEIMKPALIAKECGFAGSDYGTLPLFRKNSINTVIAAANAIEDIMERYDALNLNVSLIYLMFDNINLIPKANIRPNRSGKSIKIEKFNLQKSINNYLDKFSLYIDIEQDKGWTYAKDIFYPPNLNNINEEQK